MSKELFHSTVTFTGVGEARIDNLTQQQAWRVADALRLIELKPPNYSENGVLLYSVRTETASVFDEGRAVSVRGGFLGRLMRRFNAWAMGGCVVVALMLGALAAFAQELRARAVEPIRVQVSAPGDDANVETAADVRAELRRLRDVVITGRNLDYEVQLNAMRVTSGKCRGVAVAVLVVRRADNLHGLSVYVGATPREVAEFIADALNKEHFAPSRAGALGVRK